MSYMEDDELHDGCPISNPGNAQRRDCVAIDLLAQFVGTTVHARSDQKLTLFTK